MQFYEPGPYDDFVSKLSAMRANPAHEVWSDICKQLDEADCRRRKIVLWRTLGSVAGLAIIVSFVATHFLFFSSNNSNLLASEKAHFYLPENNQIKPNAKIPSTRSIFLDIPPKQHVLVENRNDSIASSDELSTVYQPLTPKSSSVAIESELVAINKIPSGIARPESLVNEGGGMQNKWTVQAYINPLYSAHTMSAFLDDGIQNERGTWLWGGEVQLRKAINKRFAFITGVAFNPTGQNVSEVLMLQSNSKSADITAMFVNTTYGPVSLESPRIGISNVYNIGKGSEDILKSSSISSATLKQRFHHVEIPIMLSTRWKFKGFDIDLRFGGAVGVLVNNSFKVATPFGDFVGQTSGVRNLNAAALGAVSIGMPLTPKVNLVVEPYFRLGLLSMYKNSDIPSYPFNASVRFGVGYRF
ncbi:MAG: hypothetical protein RBT19_04000 [Tenuifilaceae bacterium]|nr:hypothetical protein [Tenuifilaceae bacterium]